MSIDDKFINILRGRMPQMEDFIDEESKNKMEASNALIIAFLFSVIFPKYNLPFIDIIFEDGNPPKPTSNAVHEVMIHVQWDDQRYAYEKSCIKVWHEDVWRDTAGKHSAYTQHVLYILLHETRHHWQHINKMIGDRPATFEEIKDSKAEREKDASKWAREVLEEHVHEFIEFANKRGFEIVANKQGREE